MDVMGIAEIMDRSVEVLRKYIKTIVLFTLAYGVICFIGIFIFMIVGGVLTVFSTSSGFVLPAIILSIMILLIAAFSLSYSVGLIKISSQEFGEKGVYAFEAVQESFKSIRKIIGIVAAAAVLAIPAAVVFGGIAYLLYKGFENSLIHLGTFKLQEILLIIFAFIILLSAVLTFLMYATVLTFTLHAAVLENKGVIGSIKRSYGLVKNSFWRILGSIVLFSLTMYAVRSSIESFVGLIASIIYLILKLLNIQQDYITLITMVLTYTRWPLNLIFWLAVSPIGTAMLTMLYFNQRFKKEGYDIILKLKEIQNNDERKQLSEASDHNNSN
jgi:hypothetical protein